jgi:hypothetical protein
MRGYTSFNNGENMCIFHNWSKWKQFKVSVPARQLTKNWGLCAATEYYQQKSCLRCGKVKVEQVRTEVIG